MLKDFSLMIMGTVLGAILGHLIGSANPSSNWEYALVASGCVALLLLAFNSYLIGSILMRLRSPAPTVSIYGYQEVDRSDMYARLRQLVSSAKKSIFALTYHVDSPDPEDRSMRKYYEHIEAIVDSRKDEGFDYVRVFQLPDKRLDVCPEVVGAAAAEHAAWMRAQKKQNENYSIHSSKSELKIHSSILVIDRKTVLLGLIKPTSKGQILSINVVIKDPNKAEIRPILNLISDISRDAEPLDKGAEPAAATSLPS